MLIFPAWFLLASPANQLLLQSRKAPEAEGRGTSKTPIIFIVFYQLPLVSLLDSSGEIDSRRYPHFAALAQQSLWFWWATTVSDRTGWALPALLTGRYPKPKDLPIEEHHPENLLTLFAATHRVYSFEPITRLCPEPTCHRLEDSREDRLEALLLDLGILYLHLLLPGDLGQSLPPASESWRDLAEGASRPWRELWVHWRDRDRRSAALDRIASIGPQEGERPPLYFFHILLPHEPYLYLPTGKLYAALPDLRGLGQGERWSSDKQPTHEAYQRHLLQLGMVDSLLGALLERFRENDLYSRSLILVTSNHGASFRPGDRFKSPSATNFSEILPVPLLIKLPAGQTAPIYQDDHLETIDILPTIAQLTGIGVPWEMDGRSALDATSTGKRPFESPCKRQ